MEIDWRRKAACDVICDLPDDFDDAMKILQIAAYYLIKMIEQQKREDETGEAYVRVKAEADILPFRNLSKM